MPEVPSAPLTSNVTVWLYQPLWSAGREGVMLMVGAVASYLKLDEPLALFPALSVQLPVKEADVVSGPL